MGPFTRKGGDCMLGINGDCGDELGIRQARAASFSGAQDDARSAQELHAQELKDFREYWWLSRCERELTRYLRG
jgi:hypothetical protein